MMGTTGTRDHPVEGTDAEALARFWSDFVALQLRSLGREPLN